MCCGQAPRAGDVMLGMAEQRCLFCGGDASEPNHRAHCDGRQGGVEPPVVDFDGETYERARDHDRLRRQLTAVLFFMQDGEWHTLQAIASATEHPPASVSARLRDLRKEKFGGFEVERRYVEKGLWEYRLLLPVTAAQ
jgi:hypothetical protein